MRRGNKLRRIISATLAVMVSFSTLMMAGSEAYAAGGGKTYQDGEDGVGGTSVQFTKNNPMIILEIVPDVACGEFGYFIEGEEPVPLDEILVNASGVNEYNSNSFFASGALTGTVDWNATGNKLSGVTNTNMFVKAVWGEDSPVNHECIDVYTMSPKQINEDYALSLTDPSHKSIIDKAHLIYVNCGKIDLPSQIYCRVYSHTMEYRKFNYANDLSADATMRIYERTKGGEAAFMGSAADMQSIDRTGGQTNLEKLCWLLKSFDYEHFSRMYPYLSPSEFEGGAMGDAYRAAVNAAVTARENIISVNASDKLVFSGQTQGSGGNYVQNFGSDASDVWQQVFFMPYNGNRWSGAYKDKNSIWDYLTNPENQFASAGFNSYIMDYCGGTQTWDQMFDVANNSDGRGADAIAGVFYAYIGYSQSMQNYLRGKVWLIDGSNALSYDLYSIASSCQWINGGAMINIEAEAWSWNGDTPTVDLDVHEYSKVEGGSVVGGALQFPIGTIIKHIIGDYVAEAPIELVSDLKVLEIQPVADYYYTAHEEQIVEFLGVNTGDDVLDLIEVEGITINEFNGMTKDMISSYDMVILGDYCSAFGGTPQYTDKAAGLLYFTKDTVGAGVVSGNDLTAKGAENIRQLASSGVPIILGSGVYNRSVIDSASNLYSVIGELTGAGLKNVFKADDLMHEDDGVYYQYNLRSVLNAVGANVVSAMLTDAFVQQLADGSYVTKTGVDIWGKADTWYTIKIAYDITGNGDYVYYDCYETDGAGNRVDYPDSVFSVKTDSAGKAYKNVTIDDVALTDKIANMDYYNVKVTAQYAGDSVSIKYATKSGNAWSIDNNNAGDDTAALGVSTLRTTDYTAGSRNVTDNGVRVLQITPDSGGGMADLTNATSLFAQYVNTLSAYSISLDTVKDSDFNEYIRLSNYELIIVSAPLNDDQYALVEEFMNLDSGRPVVFTYGSVDTTSETSGSVKTLLKMDTYSNSKVYRDNDGDWTNGAQPYKNADLNASSFITANATKLNDGQVNNYPYDIPDTAETVNIANVAAPDYRVKLDDVTVWYTLGNGGVNVGDYFTYRGQDAENNYYMYSTGNVHYTLFGHSSTSEYENMLFVNLIVLALDRAYGNTLPTTDILYDLQ